MRLMLGIVVLTTGITLAQEAPADPPPVDLGIVERSDVSLTLLDVNVLDPQGQPMPNLKKADFTVILNGRVRPIYSLDDLCVGAPDSPTLATKEESPEDARSRAIAQAVETTHIILYLDLSQMKMGGRDVLLDAVERWVRESDRTRELIQLVSYTSPHGLRVLMDFTQNRDALLDAITAARTDHTLYDPFVDESESKIICCSGRAEVLVCPYVVPQCETWAWEASKHAAHGMRALQTLLIGLETLPGRKELLYFQQDGAIFPSRRYGVEESRVGDLISELDQVGAEASESRTTIHAVQSSGPRGADAVNLGANLADYTGGTYNRRGDADVDDFLRSVGREPRCVYRIGIQQPPRADGILRVKVLVRDRPLEGRYRVRFLDAVDHWWRRAQAILVAPERATDVGVAADIVPVSAAGRRWKVQTRVAVDIGSMAGLPSSSAQREAWEVGALLSNDVGSHTDEMLAVSTLRSGPEVQGPVLVVHQRTLEGLARGRYRLAAFARDRVMNVFGGAEAGLTLPDPKSRCVVGPILMLSEVPHLSATLPVLDRKAPEPIVSKATTGNAPLNRSVRTGERVEAVTFICTGNRNPPKPAALLRYVTREHDALFRFEETSPEPAGSCFTLVDRIESGPLGEGNYTYHLSWSGAPQNERIETEASFRIEDRMAGAIVEPVMARPDRSP